MTAGASPSDDPLPDPLRPNRVWRTIRYALRNVFVFWLDYRTRGMEHLPRSGALLLSNHQSYLDPLLIGLPLERPVSYLARRTLFPVPVVGWVLRNTYVMPIDREAAGTQSIRQGVRRMQHGFLVGVFPEGTRTRDGSLGAIKPGFISLVRRAGVPVIPVGISGAHAVMPRGAVIPRPGSVRVVFGEPFPAAEVQRLSARGCEAEFVACVRNRIAECVEEARAWRDSGRRGCG